MTSTADTHAGAAAGLPTCADIAAVRNFLAKCAPGWRGGVTRSAGTITKHPLSDEVDGDGKRTKLTVEVPVESVLLALRHPDGRSLRAVWTRDPEARTPTGKPKGYGFEVGLRARHLDELVPVEIGAKQAVAYAAAPTLAEVLLALGLVAPEGGDEGQGEPEVVDDVREPVPHYQSRGWAA